MKSINKRYIPIQTYYLGSLILAISLFISLSACTSSEKSRAPKDPSVLSLNIGAEPSFINPILSTDTASSAVEGLIFNGLMKVNDNLEMIPDLAETYTIENKGKRYIFKLKKTVTWHDGEPFTADDVIFTFKTLMDPKTNTVRRSSYFIQGKPIQFKKIDRYTVQVDLPKAFAPFLIHMGMGILPKHRLETQDINKTPFNRNPIGTGPYQFVEWKPSQYVKLKRNDNYFWKTPKTKHILMKIIPDKNTALVSLKKGEIDLEQNLQSKDFPTLQKNSKLSTYRYYSMDYTYLGFNLKKKPFSTQKFRHALSYAINRKALVNSVLKGYGYPAYLPASPVQWQYPELNNIATYAYNPEKSKALLTDLGYTFNSKTGYFEDNKGPISFTIITNKGNKYREKTAQILQQYLKQVGIKVSIQLMEWSAFLKVIQSNQVSPSFDAFISGWFLGLDPDSYSIWHSSQAQKGFNYIGYNNPKVDKLLVLGRETLDQEKRKKIYADIYTEITQDSPYYFLYHREILAASQRYVKGLVEKPGPMGIIKDIEDVYIQSE